MKLPAIARIAVIVLLVVGCAPAPAGNVGPSVGPTSALPSATAVSTPTAIPTSAATRSPRASQIPLPSGALGYSDFADVGWLGSYCWQGTCADVAEMPDAAALPNITVPEGTLTFLLEGGEFASWVAMYGADGDPLQPLDEGGAAFDPDIATAAPDELLTFAELDSPPPGDWVVTVQVFMPGGDAMYGWHVLVE